MNDISFLIHNLKKEKGATSIFVMVLMVVLIVFGLAALTTSLASLKLSGKNNSWTKEFYALEAVAEEELALIDQQLILAEEAARAQGSEGFQKAYTALAWQNLTKLASSHPEIQLNQEQLSIHYTVKENKTDYPKNITVSIRILTPSFDESQKLGQKRYSVLQWKEWQNNFEYDEDINFENPNFENPDPEDQNYLENQDVDNQNLENPESNAPSEEAPLFEEIETE